MDDDSSPDDDDNNDTTPPVDDDDNDNDSSPPDDDDNDDDNDSSPPDDDDNDDDNDNDDNDNNDNNDDTTPPDDDDNDDNNDNDTSPVDDDTADDDTTDDDDDDGGYWLFPGFTGPDELDCGDREPHLWRWSNGVLDEMALPDDSLYGLTVAKQAPDGRLWFIAHSACFWNQNLAAGAPDNWARGFYLGGSVLLIFDPSTEQWTIVDETQFPGWAPQMRFSDIAFLDNGDVFVSVQYGGDHDLGVLGVYQRVGLGSEWEYRLLPVPHEICEWFGLDSNGERVVMFGESYPEDYSHWDHTFNEWTDGEWNPLAFDLTGIAPWWTYDVLYGSDGFLYLALDMWPDTNAVPIYRIVDGSPEPVDPNFAGPETQDLSWWNSGLLFAANLYGVTPYYLPVYHQNAVGDFEKIYESPNLYDLEASHTHSFGPTRFCVSVVDWQRGPRSPIVYDAGVFTEFGTSVRGLDCLFVPIN